MNITSVKAVCWSVSVGVTLYMSYFVWDFYQGWDESSKTYDREKVQAVLDENFDVATEVARRIDYTDVQRTYVRMNWTGKKDPPPVTVQTEVEKAPPAPKYTPVSTLLSILMIQVDVTDPAGSRIVVRYSGQGGITETQGSLSVGDGLPSPHQSIKVESIAVDGVVFAFEGTDRENETLRPAAGGGDEVLIVSVGPDGERYPSREYQIPQATAKEVWNPKETTLVGHNKYRIGTDDAQYLGANYAQVLTNDLSTRVHYDPKTGQRAGVEITQVRKGSVAERHGAQSGDIIKSINGHPVTSKQEAIKFVKNNQDRYTVWEVVVENLGRERTVVYESPSD